MKPGDAKTFIESLTLVSDGQESQGSMWNGQEVSWFFPAIPEDGKVRLAVRKGVRSITIPVAISNQQLP